MERTEHTAHVVPYRTYVGVWFLLLILTAILVTVSRLFHEKMAVWAMLFITPAKAALVFFFFMHLKYEKPYLKALVFLTLGLLVLIIGILFFDIAYR